MEVILETNCHYLTSLALNEQEQCLYTTCAARGELLRCDVNNVSLKVLLQMNTAASTLTFTSELDESYHVKRSNTEVNKSDVNILYLVLPSQHGLLKLTDMPTDKNEHVPDHNNTNAPVNHYAFESIHRELIPIKSVKSPTAIALDFTRRSHGYDDDNNKSNICCTSHILITNNGLAGQSSIVNPCGGLFRLRANTHAEESFTQTICQNGLVQPSAIAVDREGCIWVCEQSANRIVRFIWCHSHYECTVFAHLTGGQGPSAIAVSPSDGTVYVALYEDEALGSVYHSSNGKVNGSGKASVNDEEADRHCQDSPCEEQEHMEDDSNVVKMKSGKVLVFARDGTQQGVIVTPDSQIRALAVNKNGSHVYILCSDEVRCTSVIYRCTISADEENVNTKTNIEDDIMDIKNDVDNDENAE